MAAPAPKSRALSLSLQNPSVVSPNLFSIESITSSSSPTLSTLTSTVGQGRAKNMEMNENTTEVVMSHDDVLGDEVPFDQQLRLRRICYQLLKLDTVEVNSRAKENLQFPGSNPLMLNRENLKLLRQSYYCTRLRDDGTRYMMLITPDACYLIDKKFNFRKVQMRFPCRQTNEDMAGKIHQFTLLDGKMIIDTESIGKPTRMYLIYDLMALNQMSVVELPFNKRRKMIDDEVIAPRTMKMRSERIHFEMEAFIVKRKDFWMLKGARRLLKNFIPVHLPQSSGLIFQGWDDPYRPRTHEGLLKWKYPRINSVDFPLEMGADNLPLLFFDEREKKKLIGENMVAFKDASVPSFDSGKVIECSWDPKEKIWKCMQRRIGKSTRTELIAFEKVTGSIEDYINEDVLFNQIDEIVRLPMYVDRDCKQHN